MKNVCSFYSQKVDNIVKLAAIFFMLIIWSQIKTQLRKSVLLILHSFIYVKKSVCTLYSLKVANIVKLEAILFMLIIWSKRQNSA